MSTEQATDLTPDNDAARIRRARDQMPYGAMVHLDFPPKRHGQADPLDLAAVADYLEALQGVLKVVSERDQANEAELRRLSDVVAGGRALLVEMLTELVR